MSVDKSGTLCVQGNPCAYRLKCDLCRRLMTAVEWVFTNRERDICESCMDVESKADRECARKWSRVSYASALRNRLC